MSRSEEHTREEQARVEEIKQKNLTVLELEQQLPTIHTFMVGLKSKLVPKETVYRSGPHDGNIAYFLTYRKKRRKIHVSDHKTTKDFRRRKTQDVLGVVLNHEGWLRVYNQRCAKKSHHHPESTNPLSWLKVKQAEPYFLSRTDPLYKITPLVPPKYEDSLEKGCISFLVQPDINRFKYMASQASSLDIRQSSPEKQLKQFGEKLVSFYLKSESPKTTKR